MDTELNAPSKATIIIQIITMTTSSNLFSSLAPLHSYALIGKELPTYVDQ